MSLRVTPAELERHAAFADSLADELIDKHLKLATRMADLLDGDWKGTAAAACGKAWNEWNDGFRLMIQGLNDEAQALRLAANAYRRTDEGGASRVSSAEL